MPTRCQECERVFYPEDTCKPCRPDCPIVNVPVIHYLTPKGKGELRSKLLTIGKPGEKEITKVTKEVELRMACDSTERLATVYEPIITCKECREFMVLHGIIQPQSDISHDTSPQPSL